MGLLNDFFVASPDEIMQEVVRQGPDATFAVVSASSLTNLDMELLYHLIQDNKLKQFDAAVERTDEFGEVLTAGPDGPWLVKFPAGLRDALAAASMQTLADYATRWPESEDLIGADHETRTTLLKDLGTLARLGQADGKDMYMWFSL